MKRFSWVGLITALLLTFSLLAPIVDGVGAADGEEEETPVPSVVEVVDEAEVNADPPVEEIVEPPSDEETTPETEEIQVPDDGGVEETPDTSSDFPREDQLPPEEDSGEAAVEESPTTEDLASQDEVVPGEEIVLQDENGTAVNGSIKVLVQNQYGHPVPGVGITLFAWDGEYPEGSQGSAIGSEQFTDDAGITIFLGIDPEPDYLVTMTTLPAGYQSADLSQVVSPSDTTEDTSTLDAILLWVLERTTPDEVVPPGSVTILKYYCTTPDPADQRVMFDFFYLGSDSVTTAESDFPFDCERGYAEFLIDGSSKVTTDENGVAFVGDLDPNGTHTIAETYPWETEAFKFEVLSAGVTTIAVQNFFTPLATGSLEIQKYFCPSDTEATEFLPGVQEPKDCEPGSAEFKIYPFKTGEPFVRETDQNGYLFIDDAPEGTHLLEEVSSGAQVEFTITPDATTSFTVVNYFIYVPSGSLSLEKVYCESETAGTDFILDPSGGLPPDCYRGAADFKIFPFKTGNPIPVSTDSNGYLTVTDLPVGTHLLEEVQSGAQTEFTIAENETTSYRVVNRYVRQPAGDLYIEKIYCIAEEPGTTFTELGGGELSPDCHRGPASFKIYPFKTGDPIYVSTDANGYLLVPGLPVGTHLLEEVGSAATTEFTIVDLEQTDVGVINFYVPGKTGTVEIRKYFEFGDHARTQLYVGDPGIWPPLPKTEDYYWLGNADFEIWPFGDESAKIEFSTGAGGVIVLTVPVTTQQTGPHIILEVASGKSATFEIDPDEKTIVKAVNMLVEKPGEPDKTEPTRAEEVASVGGLPVTGIGESSGYDPMTALLGSLFALLAFAILKMHLVVPRRR